MYISFALVCCCAEHAVELWYPREGVFAYYVRHYSMEVHRLRLETCVVKSVLEFFQLLRLLRRFVLVVLEGSI